MVFREASSAPPMIRRDRATRDTSDHEVMGDGRRRRRNS